MSTALNVGCPNGHGTEVASVRKRREMNNGLGSNFSKIIIIVSAEAKTPSTPVFTHLDVEVWNK